MLRVPRILLHALATGVLCAAVAGCDNAMIPGPSPNGWVEPPVETGPRECAPLIVEVRSSGPEGVALPFHVEYFRLSDAEIVIDFAHDADSADIAAFARENELTVNHRLWDRYTYILGVDSGTAADRAYALRTARSDIVRDVEPAQWSLTIVGSYGGDLELSSTERIGLEVKAGEDSAAWVDKFLDYYPFVPLIDDECALIPNRYVDNRRVVWLRIDRTRVPPAKYVDDHLHLSQNLRNGRPYNWRDVYRRVGHFERL